MGTMSPYPNGILRVLSTLCPVYRCKNLSLVGLWAAGMDEETAFRLFEVVRQEAGMPSLRVRLIPFLYLSAERTFVEFYGKRTRSCVLLDGHLVLKTSSGLAIELCFFTKQCLSVHQY